MWKAHNNLSITFNILFILMCQIIIDWRHVDLPDIDCSNEGCNPIFSFLRLMPGCYIDSRVFSEQHEWGFIIHFIIHVVKSTSCVNAFYVEISVAACAGLCYGSYICIRNTKILNLLDLTTWTAFCCFTDCVPHVQQVSQYSVVTFEHRKFSQLHVTSD